MKIGLAVKDHIPEAVTCADKIIEWCSQHSSKVLIDIRSEYSPAGSKKVEPLELLESSEAIITLGGDGTFLSVARHSQSNSALLIGVNFGTLGFLTEFSPEEIIPTLDRVLSGNFSVMERSMLSVSISRGGSHLFSAQALNDLALLKGAKERLPHFKVWVDDIEVMNIRGDGLLIATPTGSTAYSLAAGGAIVHPNLAATLLTPLLPHSLTARPLILDNDSSVQVSFQEYSGDLFLSVDGQEDFKIKAGDIVSVGKCPHIARCVRSSSKDYFEILRQKLNWGIQGSL